MLKNFLLQTFFVALMVCGLALSLGRLFAIQEFSSLESVNDRSNKKFQQGFEQILQNPLSSFQERAQVSMKLAELAEQTENSEEKIEYLCKTLDSLKAALKLEPLRARTLVTWSNVKQLLGSYKCPGDTSASFSEALQLARDSDPLDQQALFNSALVHLWAGETASAYPILKRVLELGTDSSLLQRQFIYSLVKDPQSLQSLIPAKIPQYIEFIKYVVTQPAASALASLPKKVLWEFEAAAISEFKSRYESGEIDVELYRDRLFEIWKLSKHSAITPILDGLLAKIYREERVEEIADYFSSRSRFSELEVVSGVRLADSRPEKSALANWNSLSDIKLDDFFASVGFFLPDGKTLRRIELHSSSRVSNPVSSLLRILQSDDNTSWEDVTGVCTIDQVVLGGRSVIYAELPGSTKKFWKVHFASPSRNSEFNAPLPSLIRVFGIGGVKGL